MTTCVLGLGQRFAGDDGVGLAVVDELERRQLEGVQLLRARDASTLVEVLGGRHPLIVVDAVVVDPERVGSIMSLVPEDLEPGARSRVSSHGISVTQAIELFRALHPEVSEAPLQLVTIGISAPRAYENGLSPRVARGVQEAADRIEEMLREDHA